MAKIFLRSCDLYSFQVIANIKAATRFWTALSLKWDLIIIVLIIPRCTVECRLCTAKTRIIMLAGFSVFRFLLRSVFEKTWSATQKNVKSHVFWILKKR